jgi:hypothetical protein
VARRSLYPLATWALVVLLTTVAGVREGLHLVPGMGHGVTVGGQVVMLGNCSLDSDSSLPPPCCFLAPSKESTQLLDEDDCPICHLLGMKLTVAVSSVIELLELPVASAVVEPIERRAFVPLVYHARAPPRM